MLVDRQDEPRAHGDQHGGAQERAVADHRRCDARPEVDEGRAGREDGAHHQPDRDGHLEAGTVVGEEDVGGSQGVEPEEAAGGHEGEREQEDAGILAPVGSLPRRVADHEGERAGEPEDEEVEPVVLEVRIEARPEEQRDEADERQRRGDDAGDQDRAEAALSPMQDRRGRPTVVVRVLSGIGMFHRPVPGGSCEFRRGAWPRADLKGHYAVAVRSDFGGAGDAGRRSRSGYTASSGRGSSAGRAHG